MASQSSSTRSTRRPFNLLRSPLFMFILLSTLSTLVQAQPSVVLNTPALGSVTSCASLLASWTVLQTGTDASVQTAINSTYIGIWATNIGVDQTAIQDTPTNPTARRRDVVAAPVTANVTTQAIPLVSRTSGTGGQYTWTPVKLPPNQYYVMYLRSLPGYAGGLDVAAQSEKFFISPGASQSCLAGIVQSITVTSTSAPETASITATSTGALAGETGAATGSKKNKTGAIVGGVMGGLGLLGILLFALFWCTKRRRESKKQQDMSDFLASRGVNPYGRRSIANVDRRRSSYESAGGKYGGILAAIGITPLSDKTASPNETDATRDPGGFYPRRFSYQRQYDHDGADNNKRLSFNQIRVAPCNSDMTDMATILAADPAVEKGGEKQRRSKPSSISTFTQSVVTVPYHPYNSPTGDLEDGRWGKRSSMPQGQGYAMHRMSKDDTEPEVLAWTGPTGKRAGTAMSGGEPRSSEGGGSASPELGALPTTTQAASDPLARRRSTGTSHKSPSTKASIARKKAPELPPAMDGSESPIVPPPSAYFAGTPANGQSTTTVDTGYVPSHASTSATRDGHLHRRSADLMGYGHGPGRRSSEVFGVSTSAPGQGGAFDAFAGAKDGPVHLLMPDLPSGSAE